MRIDCFKECKKCHDIFHIWLLYITILHFFLNFKFHLSVQTMTHFLSEVHDGQVWTWGFSYVCNALEYTEVWGYTYQRSTRDFAHNSLVFFSISLYILIVAHMDGVRPVNPIINLILEA